MERRNLSPDRDRQKQIEQSSLDAPFPNRLQELSHYHLRTTKSLFRASSYKRGLYLSIG